VDAALCRVVPAADNVRATIPSGAGLHATAVGVKAVGIGAKRLDEQLPARS